MTSGGPNRSIAGVDVAGRTCPYCRFPIKEGGEIFVCGVCRAPHHVDCWSDNGGCAVVACVGGPGSGGVTEPPDARPFPPTVKRGASPLALTPEIPQPPPPTQARSEASTMRRPSMALMIVSVAVVVACVAAVALVLSHGNSGSKPPVASVAANAGTGHEYHHQGSTPAVTTVTAPATTITTAIEPSPGVTQQPAGSRPTGPPSSCNNCGVRNLPHQCGGNIATTAGVHCSYAKNAFYEYWQASGAQPSLLESISVWSSTYTTYIPLTCTPGDGVVDCLGPRGIDVRFTQADVTEYTQGLAQAYASSGQLGPNG